MAAEKLNLVYGRWLPRKSVFILPILYSKESSSTLNMGQTAAIIIGLIAGYVLGVGTGNPLTGFISMLFIGGMAWFAFVWNPKSIASELHEKTDAKARYVSVVSGRDSTETANLGVGAMDIKFDSLDEAAKIDKSGACNYLSIIDGRILNAKEYGYWSLRWAFDNANQALSVLQSDPYKSIPIIFDGCKASFFLQMQLTALYTACYWVYACALPHKAGRLSTDKFIETMKLLKLGLDDGVKDLRQSDGISYSKELTALFINSFVMFHDSLRDDLIEKQNTYPGALNFDLSRTATQFIQRTAQLYQVDPAQVDVVSELVLSHYIDDIPINLMLAIEKLVAVRP